MEDKAHDSWIDFPDSINYPEIYDFYFLLKEQRIILMFLLQNWGKRTLKLSIQICTTGPS